MFYLLVKSSIKRSVEDILLLKCTMVFLKLLPEFFRFENALNKNSTISQLVSILIAAIPLEDLCVFS